MNRQILLPRGYNQHTAFEVLTVNDSSCVTGKCSFGKKVNIFGDNVPFV